MICYRFPCTAFVVLRTLRLLSLRTTSARKRRFLSPSTSLSSVASHAAVGAVSSRGDTSGGTSAGLLWPYTAELVEGILAGSRTSLSRAITLGTEFFLHWSWCCAACIPHVGAYAACWRVCEGCCYDSTHVIVLWLPLCFPDLRSFACCKVYPIALACAARVHTVHHTTYKTTTCYY